jgi:ribosomal-protein-alanine N-acetyltransferase
VEYRRLGLGRLLLEAGTRGGKNVFLEVRESNSVAVQLYKNAGFIEIARRREYYDNPAESAIVMRMKW